MISINRVKVLLLDLPLVEPFAAAHGTTSLRTVTVLRLDGEGPQGTVVGWGECSALPAATYSSETAYDSFNYLSDKLAPHLIGLEVSLEEPIAHLDDLAGGTTRPMAVAAVEMALLDLALKSQATSLASWLGADAERVPAGATVGLGTPSEVVAKATSLAAEGYGRLKVKIQPGHDVDLVKQLRAESTLSNVEIHLDANGSYGPGDLDLLVSLADMGVRTLEQPLAMGAVGASAELVDRLAATDVAVVGDEMVPSVEAASHLASQGAITGVAIKPPRIGGLHAATAMLERCRELGLAATAGGMLETGLGRHALAAVAAIEGFNLTGDLSPAGRWLHADPWDDVAMADGFISVPSEPGVAPPPDEDVLAAHTVDRRVLRP